MTKQEAIERLKALRHCRVEDDDGVPDREDTKVLRDSLNIAIECIEKQIPKKPRITIHNGFCPNCENAFGKKYVEEAVIHPYWKGYCPVCGQAIDWGDNE